jgi:hypothetical protein
MNRTARARRKQATLTPEEESFYAGFDKPAIIVMQPATCQPRTGAKVILRGAHPHAGKVGTIVRWELVQLFRSEGKKPVVKCEDGAECFAMDPAEYLVVGV